MPPSQTSPIAVSYWSAKAAYRQLSRVPRRQGARQPITCTWNSHVQADPGHLTSSALSFGSVDSHLNPAPFSGCRRQSGLLIEIRRHDPFHSHFRRSWRVVDVMADLRKENANERWLSPEVVQFGFRPASTGGGQRSIRRCHRDRLSGPAREVGDPDDALVAIGSRRAEDLQLLATRNRHEVSRAWLGILAANFGAGGGLTLHHLIGPRCLRSDLDFYFGPTHLVHNQHKLGVGGLVALELFLLAAGDFLFSTAPPRRTTRKTTTAATSNTRTSTSGFTRVPLNDSAL